MTFQNGVTSGKIGTFPTYSFLVRTQPFLSFPDLRIKITFSSPITIRIEMVYVFHEPTDDEQAEMCIWPSADFCGFEHAVTIHPIFNLTL